MRIALKFKVKLPLTLPKSYQRILQGFIYEQISGTDFSEFLHNKGFGDARKFKLFTFSLLKGPYTYHATNHTVTFSDHFYIEVASVVNDFIHLLSKSLLDKNTLKINGTPIELVEYHYKTQEIAQDTVKIEMISPLTVYTTYTQGEKSKTQYFSPEDPKFAEEIDKNLKRKFQAIYSTKLTPTVSIEPVEVNQKNKLILRYKDHVIIGYTGTYILRGHRDHLDFLYRVGLGSKNSMGFGMFRVLK